MNMTIDTNCLICEKRVSPPLSEYDTYAMAQTCSKVCYDENLRRAETGLRLDVGKSRVDLIPVEVLMTLGDLYHEGAKKYSDDNWRKGMSYRKMYGPLLRHLFKWWSGSEIDEETGIHHLDCVIWGAVGLRYFELYPEKYKEFDDRFIVKPTTDPAPHNIPSKAIDVGLGKYKVENVPFLESGLYLELRSPMFIRTKHPMLLEDGTVVPVPVQYIGRTYEDFRSLEKYKVLRYYGEVSDETN